MGCCVVCRVQCGVQGAVGYNLGWVLCELLRKRLERVGLRVNPFYSCELFAKMFGC